MCVKGKEKKKWTKEVVALVAAEYGSSHGIRAHDRETYPAAPSTSRRSSRRSSGISSEISSRISSRMSSRTSRRINSRGAEVVDGW